MFWDTNLFIYLLAEYGEFTRKTEQLRSKMLERGDQLMTSTLTLGEILVKPAQAGRADICRQYEQLLAAAAILLPLDVAAARIYGSLRSDRSLRAPDAVQLACAAAAGVDLFITNDERLQNKQVAGIQFIVPLDRLPL